MQKKVVSAIIIVIALISFILIYNSLTQKEILLSPEININTCQTLNSDTLYNITENITAPAASYCFIMSGNKVILECNNFWIIGTKSASVVGIFISGSNNTIRNCKFTDWTNGLFTIQESSATVNSNVYQNITFLANEPKILTLGSNNIFSNITMSGTTSLTSTGNNLSFNDINGMILNSGTGVTNSKITNWIVSNITSSDNVYLRGDNVIIDNWKMNRVISNRNYRFYLKNSVIKNSLLKDNYLPSSSSSLSLGENQNNLTIDNLTVINSSSGTASIECDGCKNLTISNSVFNSSAATGNAALNLYTVAGGQTQDLKISNLTLDSTSLTIQDANRVNLYNISFFSSNTIKNFKLTRTSNANVQKLRFGRLGNFQIQIANNVTIRDIKSINPSDTTSTTTALYFREMNNFTISDVNLTLIYDYSNFLKIENSSYGTINDVHVYHASHGINLYSGTHHVEVFNSTVYNAVFGFLFEGAMTICSTGGAADGAHDNIIHDITQDYGTFYDLHDTYNNIGYNITLRNGAVLSIYGNVSNETYYNVHSDTGGLSFLPDIEGYDCYLGVRDNTIKDSNFGGNLILTNSPNQVLTNVTWAGTETVDSNSNYTRKWWHKTFVKYTNGSVAKNVNITIFDILNNVITNSTTSSDGYTENYAITDYLNDGGTKKYYSNYKITAQKEPFTTQAQEYNATLEQNKIQYFEFDNVVRNQLNSDAGNTNANTGGGGLPDISLTQSQIEKGVEKNLAENWQVSFTKNNEEHNLKVDHLGRNYVSLIIQSDEIKITLYLGDEIKLDLNNDSYYDLYLKLNSIENNKANIYMKSVHEKFSVEQKKSEEKISIETPSEEKQPELTYLLISLIGAIVVITVVILVVLFARKKRRS